MKKLSAEFFGTFWLVFGGCGSALFAAGVPNVGIGYLGVALAFGLTVLTMAYAVGPISGGHFNPAVTLGLYSAGKFESKNIAPYIFSQVGGALLAGFLLYLIANGTESFVIDNTKPGQFATNGYGEFSPQGYCIGSGFLIEFLLTYFFLLIILGATDKISNVKFAGIAIGLALTLIHLISIPITNTSVNPARSTSQAVVLAICNGGTQAVAQLWLFWVAPILGAISAGITYKMLLQSKVEDN